MKTSRPERTKDSPSRVVETLRWRRGRLELLDQTLLPERVRFVPLETPAAVSRAIRDMYVRGAAYGMALGANAAADKSPRAFASAVAAAAKKLAASRPTAVNLFWAIERMEEVRKSAAGRPPKKIAALMEKEAERIHQEDIADNRAMGRFGAALIDDGDTILTHCNAGALATAGYGTALGVIRAAWEAGKHIDVIADETRPRCQGAKLTAWELARERIPVTVITDTAAGYFFRRGVIKKVVVGSDRIAANGDVCNKIGTYQVAVMAKEHGVPFYVAAPLSTVDFRVSTGDGIPIEERHPSEVTHISGRRVTAAGVAVRNPAFDVTPAKYVSAIITERGVVRKPFRRGLAAQRTSR